METRSDSEDEDERSSVSPSPVPPPPSSLGNLGGPGPLQSPTNPKRRAQAENDVPIAKRPRTNSESPMRGQGNVIVEVAHEIRACMPCSKRKIKCDMMIRPCTPCVDNGLVDECLQDANVARRSCIPCRRAKRSCDKNRPCGRCVLKHLEDQCRSFVPPAYQSMSHHSSVASSRSSSGAAFDASAGSAHLEHKSAFIQVKSESSSSHHQFHLHHSRPGLFGGGVPAFGSGLQLQDNKLIMGQSASSSSSLGSTKVEVQNTDTPPPPHMTLVTPVEPDQIPQEPELNYLMDNSVLFFNIRKHFQALYDKVLADVTPEIVLSALSTSPGKLSAFCRCLSGVLTPQVTTRFFLFLLGLVSKNFSPAQVAAEINIENCLSIINSFSANLVKGQTNSSPLLKNGHWSLPGLSPFTAEFSQGEIATINDFISKFEVVYDQFHSNIQVTSLAALKSHFPVPALFINKVVSLKTEDGVGMLSSSSSSSQTEYKVAQVYINSAAEHLGGYALNELVQLMVAREWRDYVWLSQQSPETQDPSKFGLAPGIFR
jgi:hypothetical protein